MKRVKRLFACLLALTMMLGLSATAFAEEQPTAGKVQTPTDGKVTFEKEYKLEGKGTSPEENFSFQVAFDRVTDASNTAQKNLPTVSQIHYNAGEAGSETCKKPVTVNLPAYNSVGIYYYTITEEAGRTAGVTYDSASVTMKVTVINGTAEDPFKVESVSFAKGENNKLGEGVAAFTNIYTANKLNVHKTVTGNLGDKSKYFDFTVTLTGEEGKTYSLPATITGGSTKSEKQENVTISGKTTSTTFKLKHNDTITIENLPKGVAYKVVETTPSDYKLTKKENDEGTMGAEALTAAFTNTKAGKIDTGVYLDNLPYILVFAGVLAIAVVFAVRRRRFED